MKFFSPLIIILLISNSCQKQVEGFSATNHQTLTGYDSTGKPNNLEARDVISSDLISFIKKTLPEDLNLTKTNPDLFSSKAIADINVQQASDVFVTFVSTGAGNSATIGFYTYPTGQSPTSAKDIKTISYIFPNAGGGTTLQAGDKVKIGRFNAGTSIGFVLLPFGWNSQTKTINNSAVHLCTNDALNPAEDPNLKKHAVLINYAPENKVLIGFEDIDRRATACDNDFNDVVMYATVTP